MSVCQSGLLSRFAKPVCYRGTASSNLAADVCFISSEEEQPTLDRQPVSSNFMWGSCIRGGTEDACG